MNLLTDPNRRPARGLAVPCLGAAKWMILIGTTMLLATPASANPDAIAQTRTIHGAEVSLPALPVLSEPVRNLPQPRPWQPGDAIREIPKGRPGQQDDLPQEAREPRPNGLDPLVSLQYAVPAQRSQRSFQTPLLNFDGQGYSFVNPADTVGDVGIDHYIQAINATTVRIFDKGTGAVVSTFAMTSLGGCFTGNGDPIVLFDRLAGRWMLSEFGPGNGLCVGISQTGDPLGSYFIYQFNTVSFPDYPKYGVWPNAYYVGTNESSPALYALNRSAMLAGQTATSQRFTVPSLSGFGFQMLQPADLDGELPPPAGAPGIFIRHRDTEAHGPGGMPTADLLELYFFQPDFQTPANASLTGPVSIEVEEFDSSLCGLTSFFCFAQPGQTPGASNTLDPLREPVMWRMAYRNMGTHEALVGNFVTDVDGSNRGGIRWFELRRSGGLAGSWGKFQEGTYSAAGDNLNRFMGSIAIDRVGNIALGFGANSTTSHTSVRYTGRLVNDPLGTMPQAEVVLAQGAGVNGSNRWGDYSSLNVDPVDDCTFWYTHKYNPTGSQWMTRIGSFVFDACLSPSVGIALTNAQQSVCAPDDLVPMQATLTPQLDYSGKVELALIDLPAGFSGAPSPSSVNVPPVGNSTIALTVDGTVVAGTYDFALEASPVGADPKQVSISVAVATAAAGTANLQSPANFSTYQSTTPTFTWDAASQGLDYVLQVASDPGFTNIVLEEALQGTSFSVTSPLQSAGNFWWRVQSSNACGVGAQSAVFRFQTAPEVGDCAPGDQVVVHYEDDMEGGIGGWTRPAATGTNTWAQSAVLPNSGSTSWLGAGTGMVTDQRLVSPPINLPADAASPTLVFHHVPNLENSGATACYDGGILEVTYNDGESWFQVPGSQILEGGYTGTISSGFSNPLAGAQAWCSAATTTYRRAVVDASPWAGEEIRLRFRIGTDTSVSRPGWHVDDVVIRSCLAGQEPVTLELSSDPNPARLGQPVLVAVEVSGFTSAPADGEVQVLASSGESCSSISPAEVSGVTARYECELSFSSYGQRMLEADFIETVSHFGGSAAPSGQAVLRFVSLSVVADDGRSEIDAGEEASYLIEVRNAGPDAAVAVPFEVSVTPPLEQPQWSCEASGGAGCPAASGAGAIQALVDLPAGGGLDYLLVGTVSQQAASTIVLEATLAPSAAAPGYSFDSDSSGHQDQDENRIIGIFSDDFED